MLPLQVTALRVVYLGMGGAGGETLPYLAVGTSLPCGEDHPCLGRLLLYELGSATAAAAAAAAAAPAADAFKRFAPRCVFARDFMSGVLR